MKKILSSTALSLALITTQVQAQDAPKMSQNDIVTATKSSQGDSVVPIEQLVILVMVAAVAAAALTSGGGSSMYYPAMTVSDKRLKADIKPVGMAENGLPIYQFRYVGLPMVYEGVMAQDVQEIQPDAVVPLPFGYLAVNYEKLGLDLIRVN